MSPVTRARAAGADRDRLWNIDFILLWQGQLVSQVGTQAAFVATMLWTLEVTGSPGLMSLLLVASSLPGVLLGPVAGAVVDRHSRKLLLVGADLIRGAVALVIGWSLYRGAGADAVIPLLFVASCLNGITGAVFGPAVRAALPDLVPAGRLAAANALSGMGGQGSALVGLAAGGALYAWLGPALLFMADGVSYLLSAVSEGFIRLPRRTAPRTGTTIGARLAEYRADTAAGLRFCLGDPGRRGFIILAAGLNFLFMPIFVLLPLYVEVVLGAGAAWYGYMLAGLSGGSLLGLLAAGVVGDRSDRRGAVLVGALVLAGLGMTALGPVRSAAAALALLVGIGGMTGLVNVIVITLMQVRTPPALRGRALAVLIALTGAASPLGIALGGAAGELAGTHIRWLYTGAGSAALLLTVTLVARPAVRRFLTGGLTDDAAPVAAA